MSTSNLLSACFSLSGPALTADESALLSEANPFGLILFKRNIETREQLRRLCNDARDCLGRDVPILIDQEGGRVQRMGPPVWPQYPPMQELASDPVKLQETVILMAKDLVEVGIDVNCVPVLDVLFPYTHAAIGNRAFSDDPAVVAACGQIVCETMLEYGITPVVKHMPGHGRATMDSHKDLPRVAASMEDLAVDFLPFQELAQKPFSDQVWGMAAHIVYEALDERTPSSASRVVIDVIRDEIGFDGLLLSDDLDMDALRVLGDISQRAKAVLEAGCDIALYCHGNLEIMKKLAETLPPMREDSTERYERSKQPTQRARNIA